MPSPDISPSPPAEQEAQSAPNDNREMASENYISVYNSPAMPHIQQGVSPQSFSSSAYPTNPHWQYASQQYVDAPQGTYYQQETSLVHSGTHPPQYMAPYSAWSGTIPTNIPQQPFVAHNQGYFAPPDSPTLNREAGPARTKRLRRRSAQDALGAPLQLDGESFEVPELSSSSTVKRTKPGASASTSGEQKSFSCTLCSATFTRKGDCLRHTRSVHTRETPYDCQGCGEMFSRSDMRGKHWKMDPNCEKVHWREVCVAMGRTSLLEPET